MSHSVLQRIAEGETAAVQECIKEFSALVWSLARRFSRTPSDAEDATQEIFLDIWRSAHRFDASRGSDRVFIMMIARRRLIDRLRTATLEPPMDSVDVLDTLGIHEVEIPCASAREGEHVARAFAELRPEHREVLELALLQGMTQSEIAAQLGMPLGTVKSFMRRGLSRIRELMNIETTNSSSRN